VLAIFAQAARKSMRGSDLIGRMGGEEFAAILLETSRDKASEVAERIRTSFARMAQEVEGHHVDATVSIGLVHCLERTLNIAELLTQADHALYYAKERGRNRIEFAVNGMHAGQDGVPSPRSAAAITANTAA
jgi:diguanylate cyclase (GGDEF)-like protein